MTRLALILAAVALSHAADTRQSWASDNGNGTYSNPLFYDEFSDPDIIRGLRLLPDRHHHARHARSADPALARSGELAVDRLCLRPPGSRPRLPVGRRQRDL